MIWVVIGVLVVVLVAVVVGRMVTGRPDPVDSFRRQIDALGPEARRPTIEQVRRSEEESGETDTDGT